ncbi:transforming growth factor beta-1-induced transcript 1 protein-like isoform X2 [Mucor ambiguus]|uniref:Transforming growth factor beta-1-induced transcript 1 protein-like isoform X2 n=1 Tax=Mucor ambiguus TaxID=91626 RepID=A0A0C9N8Y8_9FUNG|nr:transforming growth factor beta-1-induced transcript 1 protein-like isoform X2 [Mucor ambiguus]
MTKDQLENYLNGLPSSNKKEPNRNEYNNIRNELVYPMTKLSVEPQNQEIDQDAYGSIQDRMKRLRNATGTVMNATEVVTPAFPETPKPAAIPPTKPAFNTKARPDAFEASLTPRSYSSSYRPPVQPKPKSTSSPPLPPPLRTSAATTTPPPAVPNSPRPPKPSLQQDRVSTLNPIYAGLDCPKCHQPIEGSVVSALDQVWHAKCFTCSTCRNPLENQQFFEKNGQPYCKKDYQDLFSLHCDLCHEPIEQQAISALGKHYHEGHFCCSACGTPFGDHSAFMVHNDKPYCQEDYMKMCGKKCNGCGEYISGEYINALDKEWHKPCFICTDCKRPFTGGSFLVRDNMPYCEQHYHHPTSNTATPQRQHQQQPAESQRKPPPLKPKPSIGKKPDLPSPSPSSSRPEEPYKKPDTSSRSSVSSTSIKPATESRPSAKVCHQCSQAIDGPSASALGHDYHIHHFQCFDCGRALSSRVPGMWQGDEHGELVCKMCAFKRTQQ